MDTLLNREVFLKNSFLEGALLMAKKSAKINKDTEISLGLGAFILIIIAALSIAGSLHFPLSEKVDKLDNSMNGLAVSNASMSSELNTLNRLLLRRHASEALNNGYGTEIVKLTSDGVYELQRGINYVAVSSKLEALAFRPNNSMLSYKSLANAASFSGQFNEKTGEGLPDRLIDIWASGLVPLAVNCEGENTSVEIGNNVAKLYGCTPFSPAEAAWKGNYIQASATQKEVDQAWSAILGGNAAFTETDIGMKLIDHNSGAINLDIFVVR